MLPLDILQRFGDQRLPFSPVKVFAQSILANLAVFRRQVKSLYHSTSTVTTSGRVFKYEDLIEIVALSEVGGAVVIVRHGPVALRVERGDEVRKDSVD